VADKVKAFIGKLGLWVRKLEGKSLDKFSSLKYFVEEYSVEPSDTGIYHSIKYHLINLQSRFCKYFPEAASDKYKRITDPLNVDPPQKLRISLAEEENCNDIISDTSLKFSFLGRLSQNLGEY
jgi:hypothetical protein